MLTGGDQSMLTGGVRRRSLLGLGTALVAGDHKRRSARDAARAVAAAKAAAASGSLPTLTANVSVSANGTLATNTVTEADASAGSLSLALPASVQGDLIVCEKSDISANTVDITGNIRGTSGQTTTLELTDQSEMFFGYAGSWWPIAGHLTLSSLAVVANVQYLDRLGADATGKTDCTDIFNKALSNLPTVTVGGVTHPYGVIEFGAGSYKLGTSSDTATVGPFVWVKGQGRFATILYYYGSGRCLRLQNPADSAAVSNTIMAGGCVELAIDGSNAKAGAVGLMYGDMNGGQIDVSIQHFNLAGSVGLQLINAAWTTEKTRGYARLIDNTVGAQFTVSDGPSVTGITLASTTSSTATFTVASGGFPGFYSSMKCYGSAGLTTPSANGTSTIQVQSISGNTLVCSYTGTTPSGSSGTLTICSSSQSFDYDDWDFSIVTTSGILSGGTYAGQEGVQYLNGSNPAGGRLVIRGNFTQSNTNAWTGTPPAILRLDGKMLPYHPTQGATFFSDQDLLIQAEGDPADAKYLVYPIAFSGEAAESAAHGLLGCKGLMYFSGTADASLGSAPVSFSGPIQNVPSLNRTNLPGDNKGQGTAAQSYFDAGRPVDSAGRPYQQITGLLGANNPFTLAGAVNGAAPTAGHFDVHDVVLDLTEGGFRVCTAAGAPGTWKYFGPGGSATPSAGLSTSYGTLASDVALSGETTVLTTGSLATGTWKIDASIVINQATSGSSAFEARVNGGTATYTTQGPTAAEGFTAASQATTLRLSFFAVVTKAGTVEITAKNRTDGGSPSVMASTTISSYAGATGYTAMRVG
jgi:hypothetical protein